MVRERRVHKSHAFQVSASPTLFNSSIAGRFWHTVEVSLCVRIFVHGKFEPVRSFKNIAMWHPNVPTKKQFELHQRALLRIPFYLKKHKRPPIYLDKHKEPTLLYGKTQKPTRRPPFYFEKKKSLTFHPLKTIIIFEMWQRRSGKDEKKRLQFCNNWHESALSSEN